MNIFLIKQILLCGGLGILDTIVSIWWCPNDASRHHLEFTGDASRHHQGVKGWRTSFLGCGGVRKRQGPLYLLLWGRDRIFVYLLKTGLLYNETCLQGMLRLKDIFWLVCYLCYVKEPVIEGCPVIHGHPSYYGYVPWKQVSFIVYQLHICVW